MSENLAKKSLIKSRSWDAMEQCLIVLERKYLKDIMLYPAKLAEKFEVRKKIFLDMQDLKLLIFGHPLQENYKRISSRKPRG
jgi:hypothetical protein